MAGCVRHDDDRSQRYGWAADTARHLRHPGMRVVGVRRRQPRDISLAGRRTTRGCSTRLTRRARRDHGGHAPGRARPHGLRLRALIAVLWRAGLRISEALALNETDIETARGSLLIRRGKGDKRREAGMDPFGFEQLSAWMTHRVSLPVGPLFCVIDGPTH